MKGDKLISVIAIVSTGFTQQPQISHPVTLVSDLPSSEYYYERADGTAGEHSLFFRRSGFTVIGVEMRSQSQLCFQGFFRNNRITNMTRILPPYSPASRMEVSQEGINLARYQASQRAITDEERETLLDCIHLFWR